MQEKYEQVSQAFKERIVEASKLFDEFQETLRTIHGTLYKLRMLFDGRGTLAARGFTWAKKPVEEAREQVCEALKQGRQDWPDRLELMKKTPLNPRALDRLRESISDIKKVESELEESLKKELAFATERTAQKLRAYDEEMKSL